MICSLKVLKITLQVQRNAASRAVTNEYINVRWVQICTAMMGGNIFYGIYCFYLFFLSATLKTLCDVMMIFPSPASLMSKFCTVSRMLAER